MTEFEMGESWVRRTAARPFLCDNCDCQIWVGDSVYFMIADGRLFCLDCPPDDEADDGSIRMWQR